MSIEASNVVTIMKQALEALDLARSSHNMVLTSDPPQSAWRYHNVDMKLRDSANVLRQAIATEESSATQEPVALMGLIKEARDNCKASIVEDGISEARKEYRVDLERRLTDFINTYPQPKAGETK